MSICKVHRAGLARSKSCAVVGQKLALPGHSRVCMFLPAVRVPAIGAPKGTFFLCSVLQNTCLFSALPALPRLLELGLLPQRIHFKEITAASHLPTGRFHAICLLSSNTRVKKSALGIGVGAVSLSLLRGCPGCFSSNCPVMPVQFYLTTVFLTLDIWIQTLWTKTTNL